MLLPYAQSYVAIAAEFPLLDARNLANQKMKSERDEYFAGSQLQKVKDRLATESAAASQSKQRRKVYWKRIEQATVKRREAENATMKAINDAERKAALRLNKTWQHPIEIDNAQKAAALAKAKKRFAQGKSGPSLPKLPSKQKLECPRKPSSPSAPELPPRSSLPDDTQESINAKRPKLPSEQELECSREPSSTSAPELPPRPSLPDDTQKSIDAKRPKQSSEQELECPREPYLMSAPELPPRPSLPKNAKENIDAVSESAAAAAAAAAEAAAKERQELKDRHIKALKKTQQDATAEAAAAATSANAERAAQLDDQCKHREASHAEALHKQAMQHANEAARLGAEKQTLEERLGEARDAALAEAAQDAAAQVEAAEDAAAVAEIAATEQAAEHTAALAALDEAHALAVAKLETDAAARKARLLRDAREAGVAAAQEAASAAEARAAQVAAGGKQASSARSGAAKDAATRGPTSSAQPQPNHSATPPSRSASLIASVLTRAKAWLGGPRRCTLAENAHGGAPSASETDVELDHSAQQQQQQQQQQQEEEEEHPGSSENAMAVGCSFPAATDYESKKISLRVDRDDDLSDVAVQYSSSLIDTPTKKARQEEVNEQYRRDLLQLRSLRSLRESSRQPELYARLPESRQVTPSRGESGMAPSSSLSSSVSSLFSSPSPSLYLYIRAQEGPRELSARRSVTISSTGVTFSKAVEHLVDERDWERLRHLPLVITAFMRADEKKAESLSVHPHDTVEGAMAMGYVFVAAMFTSPNSADTKTEKSMVDVLRDAERQRSQFVHLPSLYTRGEGKALNYPEALFNEIVEGFKKDNVGVAASEVGQLRQLVLALRDAIQGGAVVTKAFAGFESKRSGLGVNRVCLDARKLETVASSLQIAVAVPFFLKRKEWQQLVEKVNEFVGALTAKYKSMDDHAATEAGRKAQLRDALTGTLTAETVKAGPAAAKYSALAVKLAAAGDYTPVAVEPADIDTWDPPKSAAEENASTCRTRHKQFRNDVKFPSFDFKRFLYIPGGPKNALLFLWKLPSVEERSETKEARAMAALSKVITNFFSFDSLPMRRPITFSIHRSYPPTKRA